MRRFFSTLDRRTIWQRLWLPGTVGLSSAIVSAILWQSLLNHEQAQLKHKVEIATTNIQEAIETQLESRIQSLDRMANRWQVRGGTPQAEWQVDAERYVQDLRGFQAINRVDTSYHVRWVIPFESNKAALNQSAAADPIRRAALVAAQQQRQIAMTHTISLFQGGKGFLVFVPLFVNQPSTHQPVFDGFNVGVFRVQALLDTLLPQKLTEQFAVAVFDGNEEIYRRGDRSEASSKIEARWHQETQVNLYGVPWRIRVYPTAAMLAQENSLLPNAALGVGLTLSVLLAWVIYLAQAARRYARQMAATNQALVNENTERQRIEEALRWKETLVRSMADVSPFAFYVVDNRTDAILYFNDRFCQIWGISHLADAIRRGDLKNHDIMPECATKLSDVSFAELCGALQREDNRTTVEDEIPLIDGRTIRLFSTQIRDECDRYFGRLCLFEDISDRKRSEAELRLLSNALESAVEGISRLDSQGRYLRVNPAYAKMVGYLPAEIIDMNWKFTVHPDDQAKMEAAYDYMLQTGKVEVEARGIRKDGSEFDKQLVMVSAFDSQGDFIGHYCFMKDISDRREIDRMKDEFISVVSHELRTPLTSISGALDLLAGGFLRTDPEAAQHMLDIAASNTDRLVRLINDILDIERIESGKVAMTKQTCDIAELIPQAINIVEELAEQSQIQIAKSVQSAILWADPDRIVQVLTNLLSNAIKFSPPKSTIWLNADLLPSDSDDIATQLFVTVQDQGRGIPHSKLETIFERFQQVDASDSRQKGGTGLGLAICRSILQQHDGSIWAESTLGEGSRFCFTLPLQFAQPIAPKDRQMPSSVVEKVLVEDITIDDSIEKKRPLYPSQASPLILTCDDDASIRAIVKAMLERQGYRVLAVDCGKAAIEQAAIYHPALILLNLMMPELDGWETLAILKQQDTTKHIPVVILSGLLPTAQHLHPDIANWIVKPPESKQLVHVLGKVLANRDQSLKVLVVEDDLDAAQVLTAMLTRYGIQTFQAQSACTAIQLSQEILPDLLVLDLALPKSDGFAVVDWLRQHHRLCSVPLVVYTAQDLTERERERLRLGQTLFFTKGRITPQDFEQRIVGLLNRIVQGEPADDTQTHSRH
jgi:PAS domain S-box-containing protein